MFLQGKKLTCGHLYVHIQKLNKLPDSHQRFLQYNYFYLFIILTNYLYTPNATV